MTISIERFGNARKPANTFAATPFRLFEDFFNDWAVRSLRDRVSDGWTPSADVLEKNENINLMVSIPGMSEKDIHLKIEGRVLTVEGERKSPESDGHICHRLESRFGNFSRSFTLPETADSSNIRAEYRNGILTISVPQKQESRRRTIKVNA